MQPRPRPTGAMQLGASTAAAAAETLPPPLLLLIIAQLSITQGKVRSLEFDKIVEDTLPKYGPGQIELLQQYCVCFKPSDVRRKLDHFD